MTILCARWPGHRTARWLLPPLAMVLRSGCWSSLLPAGLFDEAHEHFHVFDGARGYRTVIARDTVQGFVGEMALFGQKSAAVSFCSCALKDRQHGLHLLTADRRFLCVELAQVAPVAFVGMFQRVQNG